MKQLLIILALIFCASSAFAQGYNGPTAQAGLNAGVQQKSFTSSNISVGGITAFTATGTLLCTDIYIETGATGLAGGTNFQITTNNVNGLATLAAETVANLGANKTVAASAASVTKLAPFILENTKTLSINCTVGTCTGAGTILLTPNCLQQSAGASAS